VRYVPERGDAIWLTFDPVAGREQAGRRPALVLSSRAYNRSAGLAVVCAMTTKLKGYPFEVSTCVDGTAGVVLADHVRSVDWAARRAKRIGAVDEVVVRRVAAIVAKLVGV
jgi:mRNA interferase MazF